MHKFLVPSVAIILFFSTCYFAQSGEVEISSADQPSADSSDSSDEDRGVRKEPGKIILPESKRSPIVIPKIDESDPITIDGRLDEKIWTEAAVFKDFYQTSPGDNIAPSKPTEAYMVWDEKHLYLAFRCWDDKDKIRATVARRDGVFGEDNVRVWLDTYNDQRRAYILGFNPLGIQADGIFTEGQGSDFSIDIVMESKGMIHDWGWAVEVKIPFKSLRYVAGKGKHWGFNVARNIDRFNDEFDSWMPDDRNVSGFLIKHGKITGFDSIKTERTLEVIPSVTLSETGRRVPANEVPEGRFVNEPIKKDIGVTLKYTITPNVTLDAAINPDFAEVEADAPIVAANRRFPVFFPERRPFFLEGADSFSTPLGLFNSRSIVDPDLAAKITGKVGKNSFGLLFATDNAPGNYSEDERIDPNTRPFIDEFVDRNALFGVLRAKRDIGAENSIGGFLSFRSFPEQKNYVGGIDGRIKVNPSTVFTYQAALTHSRRCVFDPEFDVDDNPEQAFRNGQICGGAVVNGVQELGSQNSFFRSANGVGYYFGLDHGTDTFGYVVEAGGRTRDYRSDTGFFRRQNIHYIFGGFRNSSKSRPKAFIVRINNFNGFNYNYADDGRLIDVNWNSNVNFSFQKNTFVNFWAGASRQVLYEDEFGLVRNENRLGQFAGEDTRRTKPKWTGMFFRTAPSNKFSVFANVNLTWSAMDFDFGAGPNFPRVSPSALEGDGRQDPGPGRRFNFTTGVSIAPIDAFRGSLEYRKSRLTRNDTGLTSFDTNIVSLRSTYQFSRFVFTRARVDYNTLQASLRGQYLFGWTPSPGKAFYVGYNDDLNYNGFNPFTGDPEQGFQRNSRRFFVRFSYLFRRSF